MTEQGGDAARTRAALARHRPDLVPAFDTALPGARAAVLARLWGALAREPLPAVTGRRRTGDRLTVTLTGGRRLTGPAAAAAPFAAATAFTVDLDGHAHADPAALLAALDLPGAAVRLTREVADSVANLALARAARPAPHGGPPALRTLAAEPDGGQVALEQAVVDGHPLHPGCRTRLGMSTAEVLAYAPEHRPTVDLPLYRVPADRWYGDTAPLLVVHPWQRDHVLDAYPWLVATGAHLRARPLMSLRTLAPVDGGRHVKTAVDVQMTSAVRTVSPAAVHNGPRLSALLADLTADLPLTVLAETAGAARVDGAPSRHLACLRRQVPRPAAGAVVVPLAALAAPSPADGGPLVAEAVAAGYRGDPVAFLTDLARALLPPLLTVLHRGVALEAHGQNTLVVLRDGRPVRLLYRDLGGVRVSAARLRAHGADPPDLRGDLPTDDPGELRTTLAAAVLGTVVAEQVAVLARTHHTEPGRLWAAVAGQLRAVATPDAAALLTAALPVKATTAMRLADRPLDVVWAHLDNPMADPA